MKIMEKSMRTEKRSEKEKGSKGGLVGMRGKK